MCLCLTDNKKIINTIFNHEKIRRIEKRCLNSNKRFEFTGYSSFIEEYRMNNDRNIIFKFYMKQTNAEKY